MKQIFNIVFVACLALSSVACDFLKESPDSFVSRENFFKTETQCVSAVNSTYSQLKTVFSGTNWILNEGTTDLIYVPSSSDVNAIYDISPAHCNYATTMWNSAYKSIMYANEAIQGISASSLSDDIKNPLIAEAKVMRAFWYYQLTCTFGDVPFYTEYVKDEDTMNKIAHLGRMSAVVTRKTLVDELINTLSDDEASGSICPLSVAKACDIENGRGGWALGQMLIAKMSMWNAAKDDQANSAYWYSTALEALHKLETVYGDIKSYPLSDLYFRAKNTPEIIFEINHVYNTAGLTYVSNLATNCMPAKSGSNDSDIYDGVQILELGNDTKVGTCSRPNLYFCQALQPNTGIDQRAKINMAWDYNGTPFKSTATKPWMGPKFWCPYMHQDQDHNNYPIFRYADAVLMMAECCCALQDEGGFIKYINMVKTRAGLPEYKFSKWESALSEIQDERARELFGEFQRKFDLVRWGIWYERVLEYTDWEILRTTLKPCHEYLPIPEKQVIYSGGALDNKEYNKYGL